MTTIVTMGALVTSFKVPVLTKVKVFTGFCGYTNMPEVLISADNFYLVINCLYECQALNITCRMIAWRSTATADHNLSFMLFCLTRHSKYVPTLASLSIFMWVSITFASLEL